MLQVKFKSIEHLILTAEYHNALISSLKSVDMQLGVMPLAIAINFS